MGLLFSKIWAMFGKEEHKIVILGLDNAGKTTILYQLIMDEVVQTSPTIGSNVEEVTFRNIHFVMWDLGGQQSLRQTWATYFMNAEFVILVVDSTDSERLTLVRSELDNLMSSEDLKSASFLILANKQDVKSSLSPALISRELNLDKYKTRHWQIQPCCALTGEGLVQGMEWIVSRIKR